MELYILVFMNRVLLTLRPLLPAAEVLALLLWTLLVTRPYLTLDPLVIPSGNEHTSEYLTAMQSNHVWTRVKECGLCGMWYGNIGGGYPALADPYTSMLHPVVAVPVLLFGVPNGSKLALVGAFFMAGFAQWWLARVLGLGRVARLWSAAMVVVGGHLSSRMEPGFFGLVVSGAAFALAMPPLIALARRPTHRNAVLCGVTLALAAISGQGYLQVGILFTLPVLLVLFPLFPFDVRRSALLLRQYALAAGLALLLAAPLLVPFFHFLPQFGKTVEHNLQWAQPFTYTLFNLVISDTEFFYTTDLQKLPTPALYALFIGWGPLLLALWALRSGRTAHEQRTLLYLLLTALIPLWVASKETPLLFIVEHGPDALAEIAAGVRFNSLVGALAVPPLLALAAIGADKLMGTGLHLHLWRQSDSTKGQTLLALDMRWLLGVALVSALMGAWSFTANWIGVKELPDELYPQLERVQTSDMQWISVPGEYKSPYVAPGAGLGLKMSNGFRSWHWKDRPDPAPIIEIHHERPEENRIQTSYQSVVDEVEIRTVQPGAEYAAMTHADGRRTICQAYGAGGTIDVICNAEQPGVLVVKENNWHGWQAQVGGQETPLHAGRWLSVDVPAGVQTVGFTYRPWDVPVGFALWVLGLLLALYLWRLEGITTTPNRDGPAPRAHLPRGGGRGKEQPRWRDQYERRGHREGPR
jgi:hypothetical protein